MNLLNDGAPQVRAQPGAPNTSPFATNKYRARHVFEIAVRVIFGKECFESVVRHFQRRHSLHVSLHSKAIHEIRKDTQQFCESAASVMKMQHGIQNCLQFL